MGVEIKSEVMEKNMGKGNLSLFFSEDGQLILY
jgi:hypothetical protein